MISTRTGRSAVGSLPLASFGFTNMGFGNEALGSRWRTGVLLRCELLPPRAVVIRQLQVGGGDRLRLVREARHVAAADGCVQLVFAEIRIHAIPGARRAHGRAVGERRGKRTASRPAEERRLRTDAGARC